MPRTFDAVIIGTGQAGPSMAARLTAEGMTVAIVERHLVGGTCVNTGCTPTKTLVASAYAAHMARRAADFGVITGDVRIDMAKVHARAQAIAQQGSRNNEDWLRGMNRCTFIHGHARFESDRVICVGEELLQAERVFINVGGRAAIPDLPGVDQVPTFTNSSLLATALLPEHLIVVGGSYIGLEFAQIYRRFGSHVTVLERGLRLVPREDEEISSAIQLFLEAEGISVHCDAKCMQFKAHKDGVAVGVSCAATEFDIVGSHVLLATGRRPNTDDLGLHNTGIEVDTHGYIRVNDRLETTVSGIWALGDCNGRGAFTHTAYNDYEIVAANLFEGASRAVTDRIPCYAVYVDPPLGRVGQTEAQARATGKRIAVGRRHMTQVARAREKAETNGLMKIVVDADTNAILGGAILGVGGDEAIHCILDMMTAGGDVTTLARTMHIHPTVSELVPTIANELKA